MKLSPIQTRIINNQYKASSERNSTSQTSPRTRIVDLKFMPHYINFKGINPSKYEQAKRYIENKQKEFEESGEQICLPHYDFNKLEGIQEGIKVFEGLNIKEIIFIMSSLISIATLRGCNNACVHCYAEAKAPIKETNEQISRMDWDDFKSLTDGLKELNKRLGYPIIPNNYMYQTLFHDADCSKIFIKDKDGHIHNWNEMAKMMYEATGRPQIFDTSGWYIQDKESQKRVEEVVQEILKEPSRKYIMNACVSVNPFQAMYFKNIENWKAGNKEKAKFFKEKDSERMANTLFTLSPLFKTGKLTLIVRAMNAFSKNSTGYCAKDLRTNYEINYIPKLKKLYEEDLNGEQKVIKNKKNIKDNIQKLRKELRRVDTDLTTTNKLKDIYDTEDGQYKKTKHKRERSVSDFFTPDACYTIIDANGDIYVTDFYSTNKTDMKLNFKNKNKKTAPIAPNLKNEIASQKDFETYLEKLERPFL